MDDSTQSRTKFSDKITFFNKLGTLMRATSADDDPTPGYLYEEINALTWQSGSFCADLLDYFCARMEEKNHFVKRKSLTIMKYLVDHGHADFRENLRKNSHIIREAMSFSGPPDPLHGNKPYLDVRRTAKELLETLFEEAVDVDIGDGEPATELSNSPTHPLTTLSGMGCQSASGGRMQGFGNTVPKPPKNLSGVIMDGIRNIADRITESDMGPGTDPPWHQSTTQAQCGAYTPVSMDGGGKVSAAAVAMVYSPPPERVREHRPGVAGGGWDDEEITVSIHSQKTDPITLSKPTGSNDPSSMKSSDDSTELSERLASVSMTDWTMEQQLIDQYVHGQTTPIPKRADIDAFIERCTGLNCDKVAELMNERLTSTDDIVVVRCLVFLDYLMRADLVTVDNLAWICHENLMRLFQTGTTAPQLKARKMIRQLERLATNSYLFMDSLPTSHIELAPETQALAMT